MSSFGIFLVGVIRPYIICYIRTTVRAVAFMDNPLSLQSIIFKCKVGAPNNRPAQTMKTLKHQQRTPSPEKYGAVHIQIPLPPLLGWLLQCWQHFGTGLTVGTTHSTGYGLTGGVNGIRITSSPSSGFGGVHDHPQLGQNLPGIPGYVQITTSCISHPQSGHVSIILIQQSPIPRHTHPDMVPSARFHLSRYCIYQPSFRRTHRA